MAADTQVTPEVKSTKPGVIRYKERPARPAPRASARPAAGRTGGRGPSGRQPKQMGPERAAATGRRIQRERVQHENQEKRARAERTASRKRAFNTAAKSAPSLDGGKYQAVILAEFVACVLLALATPIAAKKDTSGISPYEGRDIVKIEAITVLYLILALLSVGGARAGRFGAWFGGLILIVVGLNETSQIVKLFGLFGTGSSKQTGSAAESGAGASAGEGSGGPLEGASEDQ